MPRRLAPRRPRSRRDPRAPARPRRRRRAAACRCGSHDRDPECLRYSIVAGTSRSDRRPSRRRAPCGRRAPRGPRRRPGGSDSRGARHRCRPSPGSGSRRRARRRASRRPWSPTAPRLRRPRPHAARACGLGCEALVDPPGGGRPRSSRPGLDRGRHGAASRTAASLSRPTSTPSGAGNPCATSVVSSATTGRLCSRPPHLLETATSSLTAATLAGRRISQPPGARGRACRHEAGGERIPGARRVHDLVDGQRRSLGAVERSRARRA